ncbi:MAG: IS3 family transposase [Rectinemataceae bacterium]|nr:IS3 family transposase [Rectinemataceae bacterium]
MVKQCELLGINRSAYYYTSVKSDDEWGMAVLTAILEELHKHPFYGYRRMACALKDLNVTRKQIRRIMKRAGIKALFPGKNLSKPSKQHAKYPYLLRNKKIWIANHVWATDVTYLKVNGSHVYLVAIIDLFSRKVLSWRISNTMDVGFCIDALEEALAVHGTPGIFNTDQGSQFTSEAFVSVLEARGIQISMDGVKRALDNIYILSSGIRNPQDSSMSSNSNEMLRRAA